MRASTWFWRLPGIVTVALCVAMPVWAGDEKKEDASKDKKDAKGVIIIHLDANKVPPDLIKKLMELSKNTTDAVKQPAKPDVVKQPVKQPVKPEAIKKPVKPDAVKKPTKPEAVKQPVKQPAKPEAVKKPTKSEAVKQPVKQPAKPDSVKKPAKPDAVKQPMKQPVKQPAKSEAVKTPAKGKPNIIQIDLNKLSPELVNRLKEELAKSKSDQK